MNQKLTRAIQALVLLISLPILIGCPSYQSKIQDAQMLLRQNNAEMASARLKTQAEVAGDDQVVFLMEYGTSLQMAGNYSESTKAFLKAEELADLKDYHSVSRLAGSMLGSATSVQYKGEDYEKVMLNVFLALNFLLQDDLEGAGVETRKINEKLYRYRFEEKKNYEQSPLAFYLAAMIWEQQKNWDSAYIDYKKAYEAKLDIPYLHEDLIRSAKRAQRDEELAKWRKEFPQIKERPEWRDKSKGELVLIYQQGWGPRKFPHPNFPRIPKLYPVPSEGRMAKLVVVDGPEEKTQTLYSLQNMAIKVLDDKYSEIVAGRVAGIATKAVVSDQLRQKNQLLGDLAWIGMNIADQADLRHWSTLPETFQIARLYLPAGQYVARVISLNGEGQGTGEISKDFNIEIKPGLKSFISWRSLR